VFGGFSAAVAKSKNRDGAGWFFLGFLFTLPALLAVCGMPPLRVAQPKETRPEDRREGVPVAVIVSAISVGVLLVVAFTVALRLASN
jgi:hypothetical protein